ncbi:signal transduction histidine kinase [Catenulispora sp. GAS73]|uniref:histidine kinase dimerization/phospho-acceptor domain-containing protein n=1 Tax=Catenulispora sp. GAS73 TaxID=3156269 RepID=UPI003516BE50
MGDLQRAALVLPADANGAGPRATLVLVEALRPMATDGTELLCALSHQLRNPLTCVVGYLEMLAEGELGPVNDEQTRVLRVVMASASRLGAMLDELEQPGASVGRAR